MTEKTFWETLKTEGNSLLDAVRDVVHQGNVRRIVVLQHNRVVAEFPLTAGVVGTLLAPPLAAIGAIFALATDCTIKVERTEPPAGAADERHASGL
jgi:hypothetical protein